LGKYNNEENARNIFQISSILYFQVYQNFFKIVLYAFYKDQKEENMKNFYSIVHFTKYIIMETRTTKIMNAITLSLTSALGSLSILIYMSTIVSEYADLSFKTLFLKYIARRTPKIDEDYRNYQSKTKICGYEINLIIIFRVILLKFFGKVFYTTRFIEIYKDCSFEIISTDGIVLQNIILIIGLHFFIYGIMSFIKPKVPNDEDDKKFVPPFVVQIFSYLSLNMYIDTYIQIFLLITVFPRST
jgi:hypothetical protein